MNHTQNSRRTRHPRRQRTIRTKSTRDSVDEDDIVRSRVLVALSTPHAITPPRFLVYPSCIVSYEHVGRHYRAYLCAPKLHHEQGAHSQYIRMPN